jgi:hypothetical protein
MMQSNHSRSIQANSKTHHNMCHESYDQSLRVIGQALETPRISASHSRRTPTNSLSVTRHNLFNFTLKDSCIAVPRENGALQRVLMGEAPDVAAANP